MRSPVLLKVGGSLLDWKRLPEALESLLDTLDNPAAIVVGGGSLANCLRDWHQKHALAEEFSHWRAISAMDLTGDLVREMVPRINPWTGVGPPWAGAATKSGVWVVRPSRLMESLVLEGVDGLIPRSWATTSDSIALLMASRWKCHRLLLVKSCDRTREDWSGCAQDGLVDPVFPTLNKNLDPLPEIVWINLKGFESRKAIP